MIIYQCDGCHAKEEHDGPELPQNWASIVATVRWADNHGNAFTEQECNARLLCSKCRGIGQPRLCAKVENILSRELDQVTPRPAHEA